MQIIIVILFKINLSNLRSMHESLCIMHTFWTVCVYFKPATETYILLLLYLDPYF